MMSSLAILLRLPIRSIAISAQYTPEVPTQIRGEHERPDDALTAHFQVLGDVVLESAAFLRRQRKISGRQVCTHISTVQFQTELLAAQDNHCR